MKWNAIAKKVLSKRPPFDNSTHISGYNLFVSAYHGFAQIGDEHLPQPKPFTPLPVLRMEYTSAYSSTSADLVLRFRIHFPADPVKFAIIGKIFLAPPGTGCKTGKLRNYLAQIFSKDNYWYAEFTIPNYTEVAGCHLKEYTLHIRHFLVERNSGYRSMEFREAFYIVL